jgi:hypothetical protein
MVWLRMPRIGQAGAPYMPSRPCCPRFADLGPPSQLSLFLSFPLSLVHHHTCNRSALSCNGPRAAASEAERIWGVGRPYRAPSPSARAVA